MDAPEIEAKETPSDPTLVLESGEAPAASEPPGEPPTARTEHYSEARPPWLRPTASTVITGLHAAAIAAFLVFAAAEVTPLDEIRVEIIPEGETVTETSSEPTPEAAPIASDDPALSASPDPAVREDPDVSMPMEQTPQTATASELAAPLPNVQSPDAPLLAVERPEQETLEKSLREQEERKRKKRQLEEARRQAALRLAKKWERARARQQAAHAQVGAAAVRAGVREGSGEAQRMSNAAYAALVSAEINRHKHYPPSARQSGSTGSVSVVFSIGPSGAITGHAITRSSGDSAIDAAVRQMMAMSHPPPPPGGHFRGSVTISFDLAR